MNENVGLDVDRRVLEPTKQAKPIDFGHSGICGSIDTLGRLQLLNIYHSKEGFAGLTTASPFSSLDRYNQLAVREYRKSLAEIEGFGPIFDKRVVSNITTLLGNIIPEVELIFVDGSKAVMTIIACQYGVVQRWQFSDGSPPDWSGSLSVQRAAYTQLTEGGPLEEVTPDVDMDVSAGRITLRDTNLACTVIIEGFSMETVQQSLHADKPIDVVVPVAKVDDYLETIFVTYAVAEEPEVAESNSEKLEKYRSPAQFDFLLERESRQWQEYMQNVPDDIVLRRGLIYARMVSVPVAEDAVCIMTDHRLLPLSWNRDAYFVAIALLQWGKPHWDLVRRHLIWMFEVADRGDDNEWGRCYLVSGRLKDGAYQLDQQLFPLLELADYVFCTGDTATLERLRQHVQPLVDTILSHKDAEAYLFPTEETPGDDPLDYKYHFSSHVLMWHTFNSLDKLLPGCGYQYIADQVYRDTQAYFIVEHAGVPVYSYATDTQGNYLFYHDANDVPLAFMPHWGFVSSNDAVWQATVEFAFSPDNKNGYFDNNRLGSVHTPAPWPLGDIQKLIIARELQQTDWEAEALQDIRAASQWDGGLPEAYNGNDYSVRSRHWFAWPNALYAMTQLPSLQKRSK